MRLREVLPRPCGKPDLWCGAVPDTRETWAVWRLKEQHGAALSAEGVDYILEAGIPRDEAFAFAGQVTLAIGERTDAGRVLFEPLAGEAFALIDALNSNGEAVVDLIGWPIGEPHLFGSVLGRAAILGAWNLRAQASWYQGRRLPVWRTPLRWLQQRCEGVVIIDEQRATDELAAALGPLCAEDESHAAELYRLLSPLARPPQVGFLRREAA